MASPASQRITTRNIILLDQLNILFSDLAYARDRVDLLLDQHPVADHPTVLMSIGRRGLEMVEDYSRDRDRLKKKLDHLRPFNANPKGSVDAYWALERGQAALDSLTEIARAAAGSPYSINVIWVTTRTARSGKRAYSNEADGVFAT